MTQRIARHPIGQAGAALLSAMLTVTLVATFASTALWQQFRNTEIETAERSRLQSSLILTGALDWARLILREDARTGGADHLAEPWAVPLEEARLSSFLAVDGNAADTDQNAFLSGFIVDMQSRLNVTNLVDGTALSESGVASFQRLFEKLDLPPETLKAWANNYLEAAKKTATTNPGNASLSSASPSSASPSNSSSSDFLLPQRVEQLSWLGLNAAALTALTPYVTLLPERTPINLNTASAMVLLAGTPGLGMADAEKLMAARSRKHFSSLAEASSALGGTAVVFTEATHSVSTRFFEVRGQLRLDDVTVFERSLVQRDGLRVRTLWRIRGVTADPNAPMQAGKATLARP